MRSLIRARTHSLRFMFSSSQMTRRASICVAVNVTEITLTGSPMLLGMIFGKHSIILSKPPVLLRKTRFPDSLSASNDTPKEDWDDERGRSTQFDAVQLTLRRRIGI